MVPWMPYHLVAGTQLLKVDQEAYTLAILREFNMDKGKPTTTPLPPRTHLTAAMCPGNEKEREEMRNEPYATVIGKLMYLVMCTHPDIAYTVQELARFMSNPGKLHWIAAKHLLCYL